jgi:CelD/BcsL family acetyltransferase involved in cellulose biosynthesis
MTMGTLARDRTASGGLMSSPSIQPSIAASGLGAVATRWVAAADWPELETDWARFSAMSSPNAFLSPAFALAARAVGAPTGLGALVITRDGDWIGFVAGRMAMGGAVFSVWTHAYAPYGAPLVRPGEETAVVAALFGFLAGQGVAALDWPMLDAGPLDAALVAAIAHRRVDVLDTHGRAVLTAAPPALSKDHRRLSRRLGEQGEVRRVSTAEGHDPAAAVAAFLALEAEGWKGRRGTALSARPQTLRLVEEGIGSLLRSGQARIDSLLLDGRPIAAGVVLMSGSRAWYWKTAYDETLSRFSPGVLLSHAIGAAAIAVPGVTLVDSCAIAGHPMIDRIWPERMTVTSRFVAVAEGAPGWRYQAALAVRRGLAEGRALAKRLMKRRGVRASRAAAGG